MRRQKCIAKTNKIIENWYYYIFLCDHVTKGTTFLNFLQNSNAAVF